MIAIFQFDPKKVYEDLVNIVHISSESANLHDHAISTLRPSGPTSRWVETVPACMSLCLFGWATAMNNDLEKDVRRIDDARGT